MQKNSITFRPNNRDSFLPLRHRVISLIHAIAEPDVNLHPIQGLFENTMQGYRAEFDSANASDNIDTQSTQIFHAAHQFLEQGKQGQLFVRVTIQTLCEQTFIDQLHAGMQHTPGLHHRLILLLQDHDLYPDSGNERSIALLSQSLASAGIQLGLEITNAHSACLNSNYLKLLLSPCVLIHYSDESIQQQSSIDILSETIRNCRSKGWPLWLDHRHNNQVCSS